jgi:hypothetical protein
MKKCSKCKELKLFSDFCKKVKSKDGLQSWCKKCNNEETLIKRLQNKLSLPLLPLNHKKCSKCNQVKNFIEFGKDKNKKDGKKYKCKECSFIIDKEWNEKNPNYRLLYSKNWKLNNPNYYQNIHKVKKQTNPTYKFKEQIRSNITNSFKRACKGIFRKKTKTQDILGCGFEFFIYYIQSQFTKGMTLENHGEWHLDHIIPISSAETEEDIMLLNHYTNFQPLWWYDNLKKGAKILGD